MPKGALPVFGDPAAFQTGLIGRKAQYLQEEFGETKLPQNSEKVILDAAEDGYLLGFIIQVGNIDLNVLVRLFGEGKAARTLINHSPREYVRLGIGLAPGDVLTSPDGSVPDRAGHPNTTYPWLARYYWKNAVSDATGSNKLKMTFVYTPAIPLPYKKILVEITNPGSNGTQFVKYASIDRVVFTE